jgi:hypothetical protein
MAVTCPTYSSPQSLEASIDTVVGFYYFLFAGLYYLGCWLSVDAFFGFFYLLDAGFWVCWVRGFTV